MNIGLISENLTTLTANLEGQVGPDGISLSEKVKAASPYIKSLAKKLGKSVKSDRGDLEKIGGWVRWHRNDAATAAKKKGAKKKK